MNLLLLFIYFVSIRNTAKLRMRYSEKCLIVCYEIETLLHILPQASYLDLLMGYPQISFKN